MEGRHEQRDEDRDPEQVRELGPARAPAGEQRRQRERRGEAEVERQGGDHRRRSFSRRFTSSRRLCTSSSL